MLAVTSCTAKRDSVKCNQLIKSECVNNLHVASIYVPLKGLTPNGKQKKADENNIAFLAKCYRHVFQMLHLRIKPNL